MKGVGKSTANAILIFSYGNKLAILDANVKRVIKRILDIKSLSKCDNEKYYWIQSEKLLPKFKIKDYTQALMDFGSLICKPKNPKCDACDLFKLCKYTFTPDSTKKVIKNVNKVCIIVKFKKNFLLFKNNKGLFVGLYALDLVDHNKVKTFLKNKIKNENILTSEKKSTINITISNKRMTVDLLVVKISKIDDLINFKMVRETSILKNKFPFPVFVKKIFEKLH